MIHSMTREKERESDKERQGVKMVRKIFSLYVDIFAWIVIPSDQFFFSLCKVGTVCDLILLNL